MTKNFAGNHVKSGMGIGDIIVQGEQVTGSLEQK